MRLRLRLFFLLASLVLAAAPAWSQGLCYTVSGNFVSNCGFETGDFTGWILYGGFPDDAVAGPPWNHTGSYGAALGPVGRDGTLTQYVGGHTTNYDLSFYLENIALDTPPNNFTVFWNGVDVGPDLVNSNDFSWTLYSIEVSGFDISQQLNQLTFQFRNDPGFWGLDDVVVTNPTPEPVSLILFGTGVVGLASVIRRKVKL